MMITHQELLETSIAQLQTLAAFLKDQLGGSGQTPHASEAKACREVLRRLSELIHLTEAARNSDAVHFKATGTGTGNVVGGGSRSHGRH